MNITLKLKLVGEGSGKTKCEAFDEAFSKFNQSQLCFVQEPLGDREYFTEILGGGMYVYHAEKHRNADWVKSGSGWHVRVYELPHEHIATVQQHARHFTFTTK